MINVCTIHSLFIFEPNFVFDPGIVVDAGTDPFSVSVSG